MGKQTAVEFIEQVSKGYGEKLKKQKSYEKHTRKYRRFRNTQ